MNIMKKIKMHKVTLNMGVGAKGNMEKSVDLLRRISGKKPIKTMSNKRIPSWGVRPNLPIACKVTVRGKDAEKLLAKLFEAIDNRLPEKKFDRFGNFAFGIPEYINIPDVEFDMVLGIVGLEVAVSLERPGYHVARRRIKSKVGKKHRITLEEAKEFIKEKFKIEVVK